MHQILANQLVPGVSDDLLEQERNTAWREWSTDGNRLHVNGPGSLPVFVRGVDILIQAAQHKLNVRIGEAWMHHLFNHVRSNQVIGVNANDELPPRERYAGISSHTSTEIGLPKHTKPAILFFPDLAHSETRIRRAVVDENDIKSIVSLTSHAIQQFTQKRFRVINGNDNRD